MEKKHEKELKKEVKNRSQQDHEGIFGTGLIKSPLLLSIGSGDFGLFKEIYICNIPIKPQNASERNAFFNFRVYEFWQIRPSPRGEPLYFPE